MDDCTPIVYKKFSTFKKIAFFPDYSIISSCRIFVEDIKKHKEYHNNHLSFPYPEGITFYILGTFCFTYGECVPLSLTQIVTTVYVVWERAF